MTIKGVCQGQSCKQTTTSVYLGGAVDDNGITLVEI